MQCNLTLAVGVAAFLAILACNRLCYNKVNLLAQQYLHLVLGSGLHDTLRGALKLDLSKNLVFCPNQVDPHPPPHKLGHPKLKKKLMFFLHFRLF